MFVVLSLSGVTHTHGYIRYVCFSLSVVMHFFVNIMCNLFFCEYSFCHNTHGYIRYVCYSLYV